MTVNITRTDVTASDLRGKARRTKEASAARRMLAIALILQGSSHADTVRTHRFEEKMIREYPYAMFVSILPHGLTVMPV